MATEINFWTNRRAMKFALYFDSLKGDSKNIDRAIQNFVDFESGNFVKSEKTTEGITLETYEIDIQKISDAEMELLIIETKEK